MLGDRSVLYKYLNPNLIVITAEGEEISQKDQKGKNRCTIHTKPSTLYSLSLRNQLSKALQLDQSKLEWIFITDSLLLFHDSKMN